jgi:hypothetical protein
MNWESMKIYLQYMQMMQGYHVESIKNSYWNQHWKKEIINQHEKEKGGKGWPGISKKKCADGLPYDLNHHILNLEFWPFLRLSLGGIELSEAGHGHKVQDYEGKSPTFYSALKWGYSESKWCWTHFDLQYFQFINGLLEMFPYHKSRSIR